MDGSGGSAGDGRPRGLLYRSLIWLLPGDFRRRYGAQMVETYTQRAWEVKSVAGAWRKLAFHLRELGGLIVAVIRQRLGAARFFPGKRHAKSKNERARSEIMSKIVKEIRFAFRRLLKSPGFALAAVATLALGIGANSAIYSVVHGVVLSPLPYPDSEGLVVLDHGAPGIGTEEGLQMTPGLYTHYRAANQTLAEVAIYTETGATLTDGGEPERVTVTLTTPSLFGTLRVPPRLGRPLDEADNFADGTGVAVLSHGLWSSRYGSEPSIVGRTVNLNGVPVEIVGVMAKGFAYPSRDTQMWVPLVFDPSRFGGFNRRGIARLKGGFSAADAQADLQSLIPRLRETFPGPGIERVIEDARLMSVVIPLKEDLVGDVTRTLWILLGTVGFVLLIACANVANLFLVRAEARQREVAVRAALGAGRADLVRHFLVESTLLAIAGGVVGLALAFAGVRLLVGFGPDNIPRLYEVGINANVLAFTVAISVFASLLFGSIPILRRVDLVPSLKEGGRGAIGSRARLRARNLLVISQVALALVLLIGAGLMARSFWHLKRVDPGFDATSVLSFTVGLSRNDHPNRESAVAFHEELLDRLRGLPGVQSAAAVTCLPLCGNWSGNTLLDEARPPAPGELPPVVAIRRASHDFFETLGITLRAGRTIERSDHELRSGAAVVNVALAEKFWPGEDPLGQRVYHTVDEEDPAWYTVVGVVDNVPIRSLTDDPSPTIFLPLLHSDSTRGVPPYVLSYVVRTSTPPLAMADAVRREVWAMDPNLPIAQVQTMEQVLALATADMAFAMILLVIAALVAVLLGAIGIYGVVSYIVAQRRSEIGVRMALGARAVDVSRMVLRQGGIVAGVGLVLGLAGAFGLTRLMRALLFGISPTDPGTFVGVSMLLLGVTLLASYLPARRASRVDPMDALRSE